MLGSRIPELRDNNSAKLVAGAVSMEQIVRAAGSPMLASL